jgi:hypothetical protein
MLARRVLIHGRAGQAGGVAAKVFGLPDKVLQQVALILGEQQQLGLLDDALQIREQVLALTRQLL